ncbi:MULTISPECIES: HAMP domain-containing sensor histidine kinase [unclassified Halorhabdus]|uniref:sensor histidine kinase n=1 Tax=unclassified Halorhabdus TaxID=2621901 RepID=UPI0023DBB92C|nr:MULTISPECIES: HAMP domain-containing sensor histidine kinase [unclassified Halorhabdus]WEL17890.1 Signal transduction histidine kinase, contains PAS domain [Halorhabdus sp. SVX81]WEL21771.1 Signal transduction histidine kinase, contains PAS domain [Halorhabdus sp. BNX81]
MDLIRLGSGASVSATGVVVFAIALSAVWNGFASLYDLALAGLGIVVGLTLVAAGAALVVLDALRTDHVLRVAGWNALGVVVLGLVLALVTASPSVSLPPAVVADVLGVSAVAHVLIGVNDVRRIRVGELARERQKLAVLNRIVRHNLRNDAQVLLGNSEVLAAELDDDRLGGMADAIATKATSLASMNEKLGQFQAAIDHDPADERAVDVSETVSSVVDDLGDEYPEANIETDVPEGVSVRADEKLADALRETIENAVVHGGGAVTVMASHRNGDVEIRVADSGPGIPTHELTSIADESEITQLEHGTGVGLWVIRSTVDAYDGTLSFDTDDGTTVTIRLATV